MELVEAVNALPKSVHGISDALVEAGVRGSRQSRDFCPIAVWLSDQVDSRVLVGKQTCFIDKVEADIILLPHDVMVWVSRFDLGVAPRQEELLAT